MAAEAGEQTWNEQLVWSQLHIGWTERENRLRACACLLQAEDIWRGQQREPRGIGSEHRDANVYLHEKLWADGDKE